VGALGSRVALKGDLDAVTAPALDVVVERSLAVGPPSLEIDLAELVSLGVAGISAVRRADRVCTACGGAVVLQCEPECPEGRCARWLAAPVVLPSRR
jgi:anti-anti-sigma regulatory factor